jgi:hypothetical protein
MRMVNPTRARETRSNRRYRVSEKLRWDTAEIRFKQEVFKGEWGRNVETSKNGKAIRKAPKRIIRR